MSDVVIATEPLFIGTARAHNKGDQVPADNVEKYGWQDKVAPVDSKAAEQTRDDLLPFDPNGKTVDVVNAYLADVDDVERDRVLALERAGAARKSIVGESPA